MVTRNLLNSTSYMGNDHEKARCRHFEHISAVLPGLGRRRPHRSNHHTTFTKAGSRPDTHRDTQHSTAGRSADTEHLFSLAGETLSKLTGTTAALGFYERDNALGIQEIQTIMPAYADRHTALYTQFGALSSYDDEEERWIGNLGLIQRWFPSTMEDTGTYLGYNAFFDFDLDRMVRRGSVGTEARHGSFFLSSNYYFPLSGWQPSDGEEGRKERPPEGWDLQVRGMLPFVPQLSLTGSYSHWNRDDDEPTIWSYGFELTPHPALSTYIVRQLLDRETRDLLIGLKLSWDFTMPWEARQPANQPSWMGGKMVDEYRSVKKQHQFVRRNSSLELEYSLPE